MQFPHNNFFQDPQKAANAQLQAHLEQLKQGKSAVAKGSDNKKGSDPAGSGSGLTYELMMKPETSLLEENERVTVMDKRLEALEKALGATNEAMVREKLGL